MPHVLQGLGRQEGSTTHSTAEGAATGSVRRGSTWKQERSQDLPQDSQVRKNYVKAIRNSNRSIFKFHVRI